MITSVEIKNLRGIQEGKLEELTPLVVLVGPNGCGKSTVLEALLMGGSPDPGDAIGWTVARRGGVRRGARWLVSALTGSEEAIISVTSGERSNDTRSATLRMDRTVSEPATRIRGTYVDKLGRPNQSAQIDIVVDFNEGNTYEWHHRKRWQFAELDEVHIVEPSDTEFQPLHTLYSKAVKAGRREEVIDLVSAIVPSLKHIEILTEGESPIVHLVFRDFSVPAALAGDGVYATLRVALELARRPSGLIMVEEPEVHLHPAAIWQSARAIWAAVRRGVQVVLTTHSLELIDALSAEAETDVELSNLSLYRLQLREGCLRSSRYEGTQVAFARGEIGEDLR